MSRMLDLYVQHICYDIMYRLTNDESIWIMIYGAIVLISMPVLSIFTLYISHFILSYVIINMVILYNLVNKAAFMIVENEVMMKVNFCLTHWPLADLNKIL